MTETLKTRVFRARRAPAGAVRILSCLLLGGLLAAAAWAGQEVMVDGVPHVQNGATPSQGKQTLTLEKLWSRGGEDDETIFGLISQVKLDPQGNVYLLDTQLSEVKVFSPAGEELKTLSREGEGPGEVRTPIDLLFMPDQTLGLVQAFPGRIVKIDLEGNPAGTFTIGGNDPTAGGFVVLLDAHARGEELVLAGMQISMKPDNTGQTRTRFLASFAMDGTERVRYVTRTTELNLQALKIVERDEYFVYPRRWAIDSQNRVVAATERDSYRLEVFNPDGKPARVITREFERPRRSAEETARIRALMDAQLRQIPMEVESTIEDYEPVIASIQMRDNGELWVTHSASTRDQPAGTMITYDVFDPAGNFVKQVAVACEGDGEEDGLFFFGSDRALLVKGLVDAAISLQGGGGAATETEGEEEPAPMEIVCFTLKP